MLASLHILINASTILFKDYVALGDNYVAYEFKRQRGISFLSHIEGVESHQFYSCNWLYHEPNASVPT